jgi:predicted house-cleaning noncanonical NTP pyrophosphatase (MazG superfamily)
VLEHPKVLTGRSKDKVSAKLRSDLKQLLAIAVVIRSDIKAPSADFPALSPRTETLSELDHVIAFLISQAKAFTQSGLGPDDFCFLIHHYIPARSGAYSLSRPRNPRVRIDSTWGVPDSLLAYPHDSFEIDTSRDTPIRCLLRCKTTFIDTDERGKWIPCSCAESHDWAPSLTDIEIKEIAQYSVKLSTHLHKAVEIMFFVGVDSRSGHPSCLPWLIVEDVPDFEKQTEEFHYAGNYFLVDTEISLLHAESWIQKQKQRTKVYLKLRPRVELLRSKKFISDVASFATKHAIPVELEGSVLQHIYYLLRKAGIRVKCTEAFQEQPSRRRFGKLVRDLIPVKIQRHGETARVLRLSKEELLPMLKAKAIEEAFELFWEADPARMLEELADILEVIRSTCSILGRSESDLETVANSKKLERGGFEEGLILIETKEEPLLGAETQEALFHSDSNQGMASHKDLPQIPHVWLRKDTVHMSIVPPVGGTTTFRFPITDLGMEAVVTYKSKEVRLALKPFAPAESPNQLTFDFA